MTDDSATVDFWFDPGCPYTWRTSRWLTDVAARRPVAVSWRLMSLAVLNAGKDVPEEHRPTLRQGTRTLRVLLAAEDAGGQDALCRLYTALGTRVHDRQETYDDELVRAAVAEVGLDPSVGDALGDESYDERVRAGHDEAQRRVGTEVGSPVISIAGGTAYFGPVVVPVPAGEDALRLFDALQLLANVPAFSELKRARAGL
ncbi:MAG: DsbA family protein [Actinomycetota bacterium]|nr:DsbA family protein [Actinomycetota bacterium]